MKYLTIIFFLFFYKLAFSQLLSGTIVDSNRKLLTSYDFKVKGNYVGVKYFELAVNIEGKVTSVKEQDKEDSFVSIPARMLVQKKLSSLEFEKGTHFPKFQHVLVKITYYQ